MRDAAVVGLGQLGQMYAGALLNQGYRVTPVVRATPRPLELGLAPEAPVLVSVGEDALDAALSELVAAGLGQRVMLLQNELFPATWKKHPTAHPTVMVVWTNRKKGVPLVGAPTRVFGPLADLVVRMHAALEIPCEVLPDEHALNTELCAKYAFIVAVNALGVSEPRTLQEWMEAEPQTVGRVLQDAVSLSAVRVDASVDVEEARRRAHSAMVALASIPSRGRTSWARMERAAAVSQEQHLPVPALRRLLPQLFRG